MPVTLPNGETGRVVETAERVTTTSYEVDIVYHVDWSRRRRFLRGLVGGYEVVGGIIYLIPPHSIPDTEELLSPLYVKPESIKVDAVGPLLDDGNGWFYVGKTRNGLAKIGVTYTTLPYDPTETSISQTLKGTGSYTTIPGTPFRFASDGKAIHQDVAIFIPSIAITRVYHRSAYIDPNVFLFLGCVNQSDFAVSLGNNQTFIAPAGTLLFSDPETKSDRNYFGYSSNEVTVNFVYRGYPWNWTYREDNGTWELILNQNGDPTYAEVDFNLLFPQG